MNCVKRGYVEAEGGGPECVAMILKHGVDINAENEVNQTLKEDWRFLD